MLATDALRGAFGASAFVQTQSPIDLGELSEPEPDIAVIRGDARDYSQAHPRTALLIVEVAESSLDYDRTEKASLYAAAGIPDYWVLNLRDRRLEVRRDPVPDETQLYGYRYESVTVLNAGDFVSPLAAPGASIAIVDLLP